MIDTIQWGGSLGICIGFYFMVTRPRVSAWCTVVGCALLILWAALLSPVAFGVIFLQGTVIGLSLRNLHRAG